jgi:hypothetical protein
VQRRSNKVLILLLAITFVSRVVFAFRPELKLTERPYQEDSFYMFGCAAQLAAGNGFSIDGVHPTNGVQPLVVVLYAPFFLLAEGDRWLGLRLTFILVGLLEMACVYVIYRLVLQLGRKSDASRRSALVAATLWTTLYTLLVHDANGLETGLLATLYLLVSWRYTLILQATSRKLTSEILLGCLLGLLVLARIDAAIFVAILLAFDLVRSRFSSQAFVRCLVLGVCSLIVSAPWWIYNLTEFGSLMPISGQSESIESLVHINLYTTPQVIGDMLTVLFYSGYDLYAPSLSAAWGALILVLWTSMFALTKLHRRILQEFDLRPLIPLFLTGIALAVFYTFFFSAPHFISRYLHPLRITIVIVFAMLVPLLLGWVRDRDNVFLRRSLQSVGMAILLLAVFFNVSMYLRAFTTDKTPPVHYAGLYARTVAPEKVGMTSSGTASFIAPNVVNLDGKVNAEALKARKQDKLGEYVVRANIDYIADWKDISEKIATQAAALGARYDLVDSLGPIFVYKRSR